MLESEALLVRGIWVLKSERVPPRSRDGQMLPRSSGADARLAACRDYLLLQWYDAEYVRKSDFLAQTVRGCATGGGS